MRILLACLALLAAAPASAQRTLHWRDIQVNARLERDGTLRVTERQTMVFTGDWNGGERRFNVALRQRFAFDSMYRIDDGGGTHLMREGRLDNVDEYDFVSSKTLRWRSRLPSDPPFNATTITYVLVYSLANILVPGGDGEWVLDHDFAFTDRDGVIENFSVQLEVDPSWQATLPEGNTWRATTIPPGQGFVVRVPLQYVGIGDGPSINTGADPIERVLIAAVMLVILGSFARRLITRERENGRLHPLPPREQVDEKWLEENVFKHLPEAIGAAWDNNTDAPEVAAVLARLVTEGRMKSEVKPGGFLRGPVLHLEMLVDRSRFHGYERTLVDALFESHDRRTDTDSIKQRYKKTGFNPAEKIRKPLKEMVADLVPAKAVAKPSPLPTIIGFIGAIILMVIAASREPADAPVMVIVSIIILVGYLLGLIGAVVWRNRVHNVGASAAMFVIPWGVSLVVLLAVLATGFMMASTVALAGLALLLLALANSLFHQARSRESAERIAFRRRLATAREWFVNELGQPQPRMKDEWFPYLIAFGLGKNMDRWFSAFGGASQAHIGRSTSLGTGSTGSGQGGGGWSGFGGGGGFSGGGASASWVAAASSMAAGVSAPSSSSSSGGGGGGGSSGGGGGGGW
jgi:uncharacterized membrane protein YgcG